MVDEFFLQSLIQIMHGEIRLVDEGKIIQRIGKTSNEEDPFSTDTQFLQDALKARPSASFNIFWEEDVYYARIKRKEKKGWILAGPVQVVTGVHSAEATAKKHKIMVSPYCLPYCELKTFLETMKLLHYEENREKICLHELYAETGISECLKSNILEKKLWMDKGYNLHNLYHHEQKKITSIRTGNLKMLEECQEEVWPGENGRLADNPVRQEKNLAIVVITLASRAAIEGGVSPQKAFLMSDVFIHNIERMTQVLPIQSAVVEYEREFVRAVTQAKSDNEQNQYVELVKEYVRGHLEEPVRVAKIGEYLGLNEDYLSGLFHKWEGVTLQQYIRKEKIRRAKELLAYSTYSCSEIATILCFSSQSHFTSSFKREEKVTPAKYRMMKCQYYHKKTKKDD